MRAGRRDPHLPRRGGLQDRRPPRPQPRRGRADHRAAPGLRLARRTGSSSTPATRATCTSCSPAARTSPGCKSKGGLSGYPSRAESEHDVIENSPRLHRARLGRRPRQGQRAARPRRPRGRRDRRRRADRRHGLGGAEQHRRRQGPPAGHRRQRQRALVRARPSAASPTTWPPCAPPTATSASWPGARTLLERTPVVGQPALRDAARREEGPQGLHRPAGHVRGPRPEVRRPDRRPRHRGRGVRAAARQALRRPGASCTASPRRAAATSPPSRTRPTASTASARSTRTPACRSRPPAPDWTSVFGEEMVKLGHGARGRRRDHRRDAAPGRPDQVRQGVPRPGLRRRHRRAARRRLGGRPGHRRPAPGRRGLRDLPQPGLRPGPDGRRAAPLRGDLRPGPGRRHRHRRRLAQRHVGHVDPPGRARPADRRPARRRPAARPAARGRRRSTTRRPWSATPRARSARAVAAVGRIGGMDVLRAPAPGGASSPTCCSSRSARWPRCAWRSPTC